MSKTLWKKIQAFVGVTADGIPGPITAGAIADRLGIGTPAPAPKPATTEFDPRSEKNLATLVPNAQRKAREWLRKCREAGINVKIICGTRTYEEQAKLYAKGRTESGKKVTWEQALASTIELAPDLENWTMASPAPVKPDADGNYPVAVPGLSKVV